MNYVITIDVTALKLLGEYQVCWYGMSGMLILPLWLTGWQQLSCRNSKEACGVTQTFLQGLFNQALMQSHCACCTVTVPTNLHMQTGGVWMAAWLEHASCQLQTVDWVFLHWKERREEGTFTYQNKREVDLCHLEEVRNQLELFVLVWLGCFSLVNPMLQTHALIPACKNLKN